MQNGNDFLRGHELWLKQSKQFFEQILPLLDRLFNSEFKGEERALYELDEVIYFFKGHVKTQQKFFDFVPKINIKNQNKFPKYFSVLSNMTDETIDLLHEKMREMIKKKESPKSIRDFYELWLDCGEEVYQKWLHTDEFLSAFGEMVNGMFGEV